VTEEELLALNPFPGLRAFAPDEAELFFGRREHVEDLRRRVEANPFVAVAGASGCGKSSLVLAGLLSALADRAASEDRPPWRPVMMRPGRQPIVHLAHPLATALQGPCSPEAIGALYGRLRLSAIGLSEAVRVAALPAGTRVLVVVDQFEELFRYERMSDPEEGAAFVKLLLHAASDPTSAVRVVVTLRSDALGQCADFPGLAEAVSVGQVLVPKLTRDQRKEAIVGPVQWRGFGIRASLVQRILNDVTDDFDDLPVMQHALTRTWAHWAHSVSKDAGAAPREIEVADYEAIGTSAHALDRHGNEALSSLPAELQSVVPAVMRALTERRRDGTEVRRPLAFDELCEVTRKNRDGVAKVVDRLRSPDTNFLRPSLTEPLDTNPVIDVTHESLIRNWSALRQWVKEEADARGDLELLLDATGRRERGGDLWYGHTLESALQWQRREQPNDAWVRLSTGEAGARCWPEAQRFLQLSADSAQRAKRRHTALYWSCGVLALALLGTLVALLGTYIASTQKAVQQSSSHFLANLAWLDLRLDPALSARLAVEALDEFPANELAERALRQAVETLSVAHTQAIFDLGAPINDARLNRAGTSIVVLGERELAIVHSVDARATGPRQELPWNATNAWLLDDRGLVVVQAREEGVHIRDLQGATLGHWNCQASKSGERDFVYAVQVSEDENWIAAGCVRGGLMLWRVPTEARAPGAPMVLMEATGTTVTALAFAKNGEWLVSGDADGHALLWKVGQAGGPWLGSAEAGRVESSIYHAPKVSHDANSMAIRDVDVLIMGDDMFIATASDDSTAVVWQLDSERHSLALPRKSGDKVKWTLRHERPVTRARFNPNGQLMTVVDKRLRFWTTEDPLPSTARHNGWINDASVMDEYALSAGEDGVSRVWSRGRDVIATLRGHRAEVVRSRFMSRERVFTASSDGTLRIWTFQPVTTLEYSPRGQWMTAVAPSPDGRQLALCRERASAGPACSVLQIEVNSGEAIRTDAFELQSPRPGKHFGMIGRLLWGASASQIMGTAIDFEMYRDDGPVRWRTETREVIKDEKTGFMPYAYSSERSEGLFIDARGKIKVISDAGGEAAAAPEWFDVGAGVAPQAAALSDDGRWIAISDNKNILLLDRAAPQAAARTLDKHQGTVMALGFSPDSRFLASAGADRTARIWALNPDVRGACSELAGGHTGTIYALAFNHRGDQLVTAGADGSVRFWDVRYGEGGCGREIVALEWHADAVNDLRLHPTYDLFFTASDDGTVKAGACRTCNLSVADLRKEVLETNLAVLTQHDQAELDRLRRSAKGAAVEQRRLGNVGGAGG
jgi:WD40 repeat protein